MRITPHHGRLLQQGRSTHHGWLTHPARFIAALALLMFAFAPLAIAGQVELFDAGWKFVLGDQANGQTPALDDSAFHSVKLPHDWSIEQPFDSKLASGTGFLPGGVGWYRKTFTLHPGQPGQHVAIRFDGVYMNSRVWINGHDLGVRPNGFVSFEYDLTPYLQADKPNIIAVRVDHSEDADSRFYTGSGIYRHVWLISTPDVHIEPWGVYVVTPKVSPDVATVKIQTSITNQSDRQQNVTLTSQILDGEGKVVGQSQSTHMIEAGKRGSFEDQADVAQPKLWSCDAPAMYQLVSSVKIGDQAVDSVTTPFGIRTIVFDPEQGLLLNGKKTLVKGICLHQDAGGLGAAVTKDVFAWRLRLLKESGCNAIRTSHNPPPPELLDLCDQMGFLVMDEAFDEWAMPKKKWVAGWNQGTPSFQGYSEYFQEWADRDIQSMVQRDRNHPSIIMWSIGNEIDYNHDPYFDPFAVDYTNDKPNAKDLVGIARKLSQAVKAMDATRPVTAALANLAVSNRTGLPEMLDVVGYNYQEQLYPADHAANPNRAIIGSENSHSSTAWQAVLDHPYANGQFLWTGFDYLGEARQWPLHGSSAGLFDECGFKKPLFYFRQSMWSEKPMVYLATRPPGPATRPRNQRGAPLVPAWIAPQADGPVNVVCYSNCDRVELFLNDQSLGGKSRDAMVDHALGWQVPYQAGKLRAVGFKAEQQVCEFQLITPGKPHQLKLSPVQSSILADGRALAFVEAQVLDRAGNIVFATDNQIQFEVTGPAEIRAVDSGNLSTTESFQGNERKAYQGKCLLILQSKGEAGTIAVRARSEGLIEAKATISASEPR